MGSTATVQLCTANGLSYKCHARSFQDASPPVLYLIASGYHGQGGYQLFFRADGGFAWTLLESVPQYAPQLLTWYTASTTTSQPVLGVPPQIQVTDAFGTHAVDVEPWNMMTAYGTESAGDSASPGIVRLATGSAIDYKVLARPYDTGGGPVLFLFATCYYPTGGWEIFFTMNGGLQWQLLERVPGIVNMLVTYYEASTTTSFGLAERPASVSIQDAYGNHSVEVQPWFLDARTEQKSTPPPGPRISM